MLGAFPGHFAAELVRRLEEDFAGTDDRLVHHLHRLLFLKFACTCGAAARLSRMRSSSAFRSAGASGSA
jgi:hypothetical protein